MEETPKKVDRFEILSVQGRGAMGVVYKARDPLIDRLVAIKMIAMSTVLPDQQREEFKERFFREARAAGGLNHPNVVSIFDLGEEDGIPFMAMEFVDGRGLSDLLRADRPMPVQQAVSIVRQVADALDYAHEKGIVHRDIKPDNILVDDQGRAVVTDFGVARFSASDLTRTGEVLGTPHFMSPEQVLGDPVDGRSDIFSLGVVFYQLLAGRRPFKGDSISSVCYHIVHSPPEPVPEDREIPAEVAPILDRMLSKKREERYRNAGEVSLALDEAVPGTRSFTPSGLYRTEETAAVPGAGSPAVSPPPESPTEDPPVTLVDEPAPPPKRSKALYWILPPVLLVGALLAAAAGIGLAAKFGTPGPPQAQQETAVFGMVYEGKLPDGLLRVFLDGELAWGADLRAARGSEGKGIVTISRKFSLPPGTHDYRILVTGTNRYQAEAVGSFTVEAGVSHIIKVVPRRSPDRLVIVAGRPK